MLKWSQRVPPGGAEEGGRKHRKLVKSDDLGLRVPLEPQPLQDGAGGRGGGGESAHPLAPLMEDERLS